MPAPSPNIEQLKKQAKDLLKAHKAADPRATLRLRQTLPELDASSDAAILQTKLALKDTQRAIARECGFAHWTDLKRHVESLTSSTLTSHAATVGHYERQAVALIKTTTAKTLDEARLRVARLYGFRNWWRLVAAIDAQRKTMATVRSVPTAPDWDIKKEARILLKEARRGDPEALRSFRHGFLHYAETSNDELAKAVTLRQAQWLMEAEYGGVKPEVARETPQQQRAWMDRLWSHHDRLGWSRRRRVDMSAREQEFVEAAMATRRGRTWRPYRASKPWSRKTLRLSPSPVRRPWREPSTGRGANLSCASSWTRGRVSITPPAFSAP